jgi:predicted Fe-Mo cluster-binding NifX family protein
LIRRREEFYRFRKWTKQIGRCFMKIAISATGPSLDSPIDPRFGRCQYLLIVDSESLDFEAVENPAVMAPGGAGIQAAELVASMGAGAVITGNCGPNAYQVLSAAGIDIFVGASGSVRQALEAYRKGELQATAGPSTGPYSGMGSGMGRGMGGGMGRGMGGGMGRGMGGGRGGGMGGGRGGGMGGGRGGGMGGGRGGDRGQRWQP